MTVSIQNEKNGKTASKEQAYEKPIAMMAKAELISFVSSM